VKSAIARLVVVLGIIGHAAAGVEQCHAGIDADRLAQVFDGAIVIGGIAEQAGAEQPHIRRAWIEPDCLVVIGHRTFDVALLLSGEATAGEGECPHRGGQACIFGQARAGGDPAVGIARLSAGVGIAVRGPRHVDQHPCGK
jgi:hypothetical protein